MRNVITLGSLSLLILVGCTENSMNIVAPSEIPANATFETGLSSKEDASYWYSAKAEITSFRLEQARYGEVHEGTAVFVFVTEPFSTENFVKADNPGSDAVSVLKLNQTRKFNTGIYPYSIMTSSFLPFKEGDHSIKVSSTSQEWCGHTYMEVKNPQNGQFGVQVDSYFEGETYDETKSVRALMEDDIWTILRIRETPPTGEFSMYPSLAATRLLHINFEPYTCQGSIKKNGNSIFYTLNYPQLDRTLVIEYEKAHPHRILGWTESNLSGYGAKRKKLTTTATRMKTINTDYWNRNSIADSTYRKELMLD